LRVTLADIRAQLSMRTAPSDLGNSQRLLTAKGAAGRLRDVLTLFGACAVTFMVMMYSLESRGRGFILAFACGCVLSSVYGFLAGTWPFGVVEAIWAVIALKRYQSKPMVQAHSPEA
jgi:hypothetical protein